MTDAELWDLFTTQRLAHSDWNHLAHVRIAFLHLAAVDFDLDEAHIRIRAGIIRLNERHGIVETSRRGYFETLTRAWAAIVRDAALESGAVDSLTLLAQRPELTDRSLTERYYSPGVLTSARARAMFVEPDRAPLPVTSALLMGAGGGEHRG